MLLGGQEATVISSCQNIENLLCNLKLMCSTCSPQIVTLNLLAVYEVKLYVRS